MKQPCRNWLVSPYLLIGMLLGFLFALSACDFTPSSRPAPRLSPIEAQTALRAYFYKEIVSIPISDRRDDWETYLDSVETSTRYEGESKWILTGPGVVQKEGGDFDFTDGKWLLEETGLRITPVNSEADTLLGFLTNEQRNYPTATPRPTSTPAPIVISCPEKSDFGAKIDPIWGVQVWAKITNTCDTPISVTYSGVAYDKSMKVVAASRVGGYQVLLQAKEWQLVSASVGTPRGGEVAFADLLIKHATPN